MRSSPIRIALIAAPLLAAPLLADSLQIGPVKVIMVGPERTATLTVRNQGDAPTNVQIRTLDWDQATGTDNYVPSTTLLASPPAAMLAPGEAQVVRLVIENLPSPGGERAYRVVVDQIPDPRAKGGAGVRAAIRALVPVFLSPSVNPKPSLAWRAQRSGNDLVLTATNRGAGHDRLTNLVVTTDGKAAGQPLEGYVLANSSRSWTVPAAAAAQSVKVAASGDWGQVEADVPIAP